jgi:hypothetical protein
MVAFIIVKSTISHEQGKIDEGSNDIAMIIIMMIKEKAFMGF